MIKIELNQYNIYGEHPKLFEIFACKYVYKEIAVFCKTQNIRLIQTPYLRWVSMKYVYPTSKIQTYTSYTNLLFLSKIYSK